MGAPLAGLRPVVELMFVDFMGVCFDQIFNQAAKFRYMFGGKAVDAGGDPHHDRRRFARGGATLPDACIRFSPTYPGLKCVVPVHALRCERPADPGHPR